MANPDSQWPEITATLFHRPLTTSPSTTPTHITDTTLASFIETIKSLHTPPLTQLPYESSYLDNPTHPHIARLTFTPHFPLPLLRNNPNIQSFEETHTLLAVFQCSTTAQTPKRLAVFDMDSTIIQQEVIELLAAEAGVEAEVADVTSRAMNGELDFTESLHARVALLKGVRADVFDSLKPRVTLSPGADVLLRVLKATGVKTALLSGGFTPLARWVAERLGIDHVHANDLASEDGVLTGKLAPETVIVDGKRKEELLGVISRQEGVTRPEEVLAVGDGANDLPMLWAAGLGVAVNAKPRVQVEAPARLNGKLALLDVLFLIGLTAEEIDRLSGDGD